MQSAIWQATKLASAMRLATVDQLRRAIKGATIDVKAEELQRKENEKRRKQEEEQRRKTAASVTTVTTNKLYNTAPSQNSEKTADAKEVGTKPTKTQTVTQKKDNTNKKSILAVLVTIIVIGAIAAYLFINKPNNKATIELEPTNVTDTTNTNTYQDVRKKKLTPQRHPQQKKRPPTLQQTISRPTQINPRQQSRLLNLRPLVPSPIKITKEIQQKPINNNQQRRQQTQQLQVQLIKKLLLTTKLL